MSAQLKADILRFLRTMGEPVQADEIAEACGSPEKAMLAHTLRELVGRGGVICKHKNIGNVYMLRGSEADSATDDGKDDASDDDGGSATNGSHGAAVGGREPTPSPKEATQRYGSMSAQVFDCLVSATKPLVNGEIRSATGLSTTQVNSALLTLRRSGQATRYGDNTRSVWVYAHAPQAVLAQIPSDIAADAHGIERAKPRFETLAMKEVSALLGGRPVDLPKADAAVSAPLASRVLVPLAGHIAAVVLDVDELLGDAISEQASHDVLAHIQRASRELRLALAVSKGA
jgi:predicted transcriptional regulator